RALCFVSDAVDKTTGKAQSFVQIICKIDSTEDAKSSTTSEHGEVPFRSWKKKAFLLSDEESIQRPIETCWEGGRCERSLLTCFLNTQPIPQHCPHYSH